VSVISKTDWRTVPQPTFLDAKYDDNKNACLPQLIFQYGFASSFVKKPATELDNKLRGMLGRYFFFFFNVRL
jgi:hypothetical protein